MLPKVVSEYPSNLHHLDQTFEEIPQRKRFFLLSANQASDQCVVYKIPFDLTYPYSLSSRTPFLSQNIYLCNLVVLLNRICFLQKPYHSVCQKCASFDWMLGLDSPVLSKVLVQIFPY